MTHRSSVVSVICKEYFLKLTRLKPEINYNLELWIEVLELEGFRSSRTKTKYM